MSRHPVHVTLRVERTVARLRGRRCHAAVLQCLRASTGAKDVRIVHYSVMRNHIHLMVEAADRFALSRGMQGFSIRLARALNRVFGRKGRVFCDRYHAKILRTPLEVRRGLAYVLNNARRNGVVGTKTPATWLDPCSSAATFDGWKTRLRGVTSEAPVSKARTWLLTFGWRKHGLIDPAYVPASAK